MSVLATGGAGYVGGVAVDQLVTRGNSVVIVDNLSRSSPNGLPASIPFY